MTAVAKHRAGPIKAGEESALLTVVARLQAQFPELDKEQIEQAVHGRHDAFEQSPIRDFVPILVERSARDDLKGEYRQHRA